MPHQAVRDSSKKGSRSTSGFGTVPAGHMPGEVWGGQRPQLHPGTPYCEAIPQSFGRLPQPHRATARALSPERPPWASLSKPPRWWSQRRNMPHDPPEFCSLTLRAESHLPTDNGAQSDSVGPHSAQAWRPRGQRGRMGATVEPSGHSHRQGSSATRTMPRPGPGQHKWHKTRCKQVYKVIFLTIFLLNKGNTPQAIWGKRGAPTASPTSHAALPHPSTEGCPLHSTPQGIVLPSALGTLLEPTKCR